MKSIRAFAKTLLRFLADQIVHLITWAVSLPGEKVMMGLFIFALLQIGFFAGLQHYTTSRPQFCMTCHLRQGHSDFWKDSLVHPSSVGCTDCHARHGEVLPRNYSADADRVNPACLRCHGEMTEREDTVGFKYNPYQIIISHKLHIEKARARCTDCHYNVRHDKVSPATNRPRMEACEQCHDLRTTHCTQCHPDGALEVPRGKKIEARECVKCHPMYKEKTVEVYGVEFTHPQHLAASIPCDQCHSNAERHGTLVGGENACRDCHHRQAKTKCMICHGGSLGLPRPTTIDPDKCEKCHSGYKAEQNKIYDISFLHGPHLASGVECGKCHANQERHGQITPTKQDCLHGCHQSTRPASHEQNWQQQHGRTAKSNPTRCQMCHEKQYCVDCHGLPMPHPSDWRRTHPATARQRGQLCPKCHASNACATCHQQMKPASHSPPQWRRSHSRWARGGCVTCHGTNGCRRCHGLTMPHPAGWQKKHGATAVRNRGLCRKCHRDRQCQDCHQGVRPASHGAAHWKQKGHGAAGQAEGATCRTCHTASFCRDRCHGGLTMPHPDNWMMQGHARSGQFGTSSPCFKCHQQNWCYMCHERKGAE